MGAQNKEIKVALDISAKIDRASSQIKSLKSQIDNFQLSKSLSADFVKEFKNIENEIIELQRRVGDSGEINLIDSKAAEKEIDKIEKKWSYLLSKIGEEGFLEKGLKADAVALDALKAIQDSYIKGIKEAELQEQKLNKKLEEAKQHEKDLLETQKAQKVVKASELNDQKAQLALAEKEEKAAKKARDEAEKALRAKVAESGGKYTMEEASVKGSKLRKTDAYRNFRDAQAAYDTAKQRTKAERTKTGSMVTKEMQVEQAKEAKKAIDEATAALKKYQENSLKTAKTDAFKEAKESIKDIAEFKDIDWSAFDIDISGIKDAKELEKVLEELRIEAEKRAKKAMEEMEVATKGASEEFKDMEKDIQVATNALEDLDEQARQVEAFEQRIKQFLGMAGAVELLRRALSQAFETTKELDAAMTEMAVVTNLGVSDYWEQLPEHTKRASELGVAIKEVYEAETLYYQQGLKTAEAQSLANETLKMARIAGMEASEATDKMTAALRGFNMELNETSAQKVADVYSELAAITAADVNEISSAMTKTASIASSAGMEFETTAAFLSQIIETTRESAETAGTAMKTVIARFQELKKAPGEIGDVDGEIVDANAIETALRSVGVSLRDSSGQFRELDDVFLELSSKWSSLDKNTQRYIATIAAGSRQQSRFIAMMSDYGRTQELVTAANNSAGASQKQYEKTLESLETKLAKLKNAWDEFSMGILQSDLVKFGVDALTKFLEIVNKATSAFSGLGGTITKVLTTIVMFKIGQKIFDKIKQPMMNFLTSIVAEIYEKGIKGGEAYAKGAQQGAKNVAENKKPENTQEKDKEELVKTKSFKDTLKEKTGFDKFKDQEAQNIANKPEFEKFKQMKQEGNRKVREKNYINAKKNLDVAEMHLNNKAPNAEKEWEQAQAEFEVAEKNLKDYNEQEKKVQEASIEGWKNVGAGLQQVGGAVAGVGVGVSMLGGIFASLGLEELGELFSGVGNVLIVIGGAISFLGSIIPAVASIASAAGISIQASWWPLLVIMLAIVATVGIIAGVMAIVKAFNDQKYENRVKAAEEATARAKEMAEEAQAAYEELLSAKDGYDDLQKQLDNLTRGTDEWKEALRESNAQVLELLKTYPELAKYLTRGEYGELEISNAGWDNMIAKQERAIQNTQANLMSSQLTEMDLKMEGEKKDFTDSSRVMRTNSEGQQYEVYHLSEQLREELEQIYLVSESNLESMEGKTEELAKKYGVTVEQIKRAGAELSDSSAEINSISEQSENIARAYLTSMMSQEAAESNYGDAAADAFANSMNSEATQTAINEQVVDLKETSDYAGSEEFMRLAKEYGVENEMTGSDTHDLQTLYAAVMGLESVEDIPDAIAKDRETMLKEIAKVDQTNKLVNGMEEYTRSLEKLSFNDKTRANNIAGLLSDEGRGMSREYANKFMTGENGTGTFNRDAVAEEAKALGYETVDEWAKDLGKTTEELYDEIEKNVRSSITINESSFKRLNKVLGKTDGKITKFGNEVSLSVENQGALANKIVESVQVAGVEGGEELRKLLNTALEGAGEDADQLANILGTMNWNSADDWAELPELLKNLGINVPIEAIENLTNKAKELGLTIETVNFDTVSNGIQNMYDLMKSIQSGSQGRVFDSDSYKILISSNEKLAEDFVQIGDEFHYLGGIIEELIETLKQSAALESQKAATQLESQKQVSDNVKAFEETGATTYTGDTLKLGNGYGDWSKQEMIAYLEEYQTYAINSGIETLSYVTDEKGESLGFSLGTNVTDLSEDKLKAILGGLDRLEKDNTKLETESKKAVSDARIAAYTLLKPGENIEEAQANRTTGNEQVADEFSKALSIQATESGMVAESVIAEYNDLISQDLSKLSVEERDAAENRMAELENSMESSLEHNAELLEDLRTVNDMTNRVSEALYSIRQNEIDKLSAINDSINNANESMVSKIQEQIDDARQARENEKTEQEIADDQSKLAYLMADTSGGNALAAQSLQKEITEKQENYQDNLIDQSLQKLSDDNAAAAEQRERQIALMEAQLEHDQTSGELAREAEQITHDSLSAINQGTDPLSTDLYNILSEAETIEGGMATESMVEQFKGEFKADATQAANSYKDIHNLEAKGTKEATLSALKKWLEDEKKRRIAEENAAADAERKKEAKRGALQTAIDLVGSDSNKAGIYSAQKTKEYQEALQTYTEIGGTKAEFESAIKENLGEKAEKQAKEVTNFSGWGTSGAQILNTHDINEDNAKDDGYANINGSWYWLKGAALSEGDMQAKKAANEAARAADIPDKKLFMYKGALYAADYEHDYAVSFVDNNWLTTVKGLIKYKTGGLADFTGPAWLDGSKSHPELVLNARDTENFIQLKDILAEVMAGTNNTSNSNQTSKGDNYFNIDISVEELKDDYDVEQLANKIRSMLYEDATYRNVNAISHIR